LEAKSHKQRGERTEYDRNLLFGVLAVQLRRVTPAQLIEVAAAWAAEPSLDLATRLVNTGLISEKDRDLILGFIDQAVQAHGGDTKATLSAFGGEEQIHQSFGGSIERTESGGIRSVTPTVEVLEEIDPDAVPGVYEPPGRYTMLREHAQGGMGRILLVHDKHLSRDIALKELLPAPVPSTSEGQPSPVRLSVPWIARFLQEARIAGQLEHPAIVPVYELGHRRDGTLYYTMKLVRGKTLAQAIKEASSLRERLDLLPHFVDLCQAIAYAHSRGVIHRDIKPGNVMVGEFGETVVIDWGLAKARGRKDIHAEEMAETIQVMRLGDEAAVTKTAYGQAIGTPLYMSPEQAQGDIDAVDERSDVYSLGTVLYEILTGKPPFSGSSTREILSKVINDKPEPLLTAQPDTPPELAAICARAMARDPARRYPSAKDVAEEVQRFLSGALVQAYQYRFSEHLRRFVSRHKATLTTAAIALLALVGVGIYSYTNIVRARGLERQLRLEAEVARTQAEQAREEAVKAREAAEALAYQSSVRLLHQYVNSQNYGFADEFVWKLPEAYRNWEWGHCLGLLHQELFSVNGNFVEVNPQGSLILTYSQNHHEVHELTSGELLWTEPRQDIAWARFTADEERILVAKKSDDHYELMSVRLPFNSVERVLRYPPNSRGKAVMSPDRTRLAHIFDNDMATVKVFDVDSLQEIATFSDRKVPISFVKFSPDGTKILTVSKDQNAILWDVNTGTRLWSVSTGGITAFSPNGEALLVTSPEGDLVLWNTTTRERLWSASPFYQERVTTCVFSPDGFLLAVGCTGGSVKVLGAENGSEVKSFEGFPDAISTLVFDMQSRRLFIGSRDGIAKIWDVKAGEELAYLSLQPREGRIVPNMIPQAAFTPDGTRVVLGFVWSDQTTIWDVRGPFDRLSLSPTMAPQCPRGYQGFPFGSDGSRIALLSYDAAAVWDSDLRQRVIIIWPFPWRAALSPDGNRLLITSGSSGIVWDIERQEHPRANMIEGLSSRHDNATAFNHTGDRILALDADGRIKIWGAAPWETTSRVLGFKELATLGGDVAETLESAVFSADGTRAAFTASYGNGRYMTKLCDGATGQEIVSLSGLRDVEFTPDGKWVLHDSEKRQDISRDVKTGEVVKQVEWGEENRHRCRFAPDGKSTVDLCGDDVVFRDADTWQQRIVFRGHSEPVRDFAFSPDGTRMVTGANDKTVKVWDIATGQELITLSGHTGPVYKVTFSEDGTRILAASEDGTCRMWSAAPWRPESLPGSELMTPKDKASLLEKRYYKGYSIYHADEIFVTRQIIREALSRVISDVTRLADEPKQDGSGLRVTEGIRLEALATLGLEKDDVILRVNDTKVEKEGSVVEAFRGFLGELDQVPGDPPLLRLSVVRENKLTPITVCILTWQDRFNLWKRERAVERSERIKDRAEILDTVVVSDETLRRAFRRLLATSDSVFDVTQGQSSEKAEGFWVTEGPRLDALRPIAFLENDLITHINGKPVDNGERALAEISAVLESLENGSASRFEMRLVRAERFWLVRFLCERVEVARQQVIIPTNVARMFFPSIVAGLEASQAGIRRTQGEIAKLLGEPEDDLGGIWLIDMATLAKNAGVDPVIGPYIQQLNLSDGQRILSINGKPLNSVDTLFNVLHEVQKQLATQERVMATMVVQRNPFHWVKYTFVTR